MEHHILTLASREAIDESAFLDLLCYRHQRHHILSLRSVLGDEYVVMLLNRFSAMYVRFPTPRKSQEAADDLILSVLWREMKEKSKGPPLDWNEAEGKFIRQAQRMGLNYKKACVRARAVNKELEKAQAWLDRIREQEARPRRDP
jgi:hypothetical protein